MIFFGGVACCGALVLQYFAPEPGATTRTGSTTVATAALFVEAIQIQIDTQVCLASCNPYRETGGYSLFKLPGLAHDRNYTLKP